MIIVSNFHTGYNNFLFNFNFYCNMLGQIPLSGTFGDFFSVLSSGKKIEFFHLCVLFYKLIFYRTWVQSLKYVPENLSKDIKNTMDSRHEWVMIYSKKQQIISPLKH